MDTIPKCANDPTDSRTGPRYFIDNVSARGLEVSSLHRLSTSIESPAIREYNNKSTREISRIPRWWRDIVPESTFR
jgi:hypothetical protein